MMRAHNLGIIVWIILIFGIGYPLAGRIINSLVSAEQHFFWYVDIPLVAIIGAMIGLTWYKPTRPSVIEAVCLFILGVFVVGIIGFFFLIVISIMY